MNSFHKHALSFLAAATSLCLSSSNTFADAFSAHEHPASKATEVPANLPWLTGPLLTPSGHVVPAGHWNFEPYLFVTTEYGVYNADWTTTSVPKFYNINAEFPIQYGIIYPIDFQFVPQFSWNHTDGASQWVLNDLPLILDIQLLSDKKDKWWPAIKFTVSAKAPIGKYQKLDPNELGTDIGGAGTWNETVAVVFARLFQFTPIQFLSTRFYCGYTVPNPVHVKNLNAYGGGKGTRGKVYPGNWLVTLIGLEYTPAVNWALACDFAYEHQNKTRFSGKTAVPVGGPSNEQFSIAPAFEYNWSAYVGIIAGAWFTVAGRNSAEFASAVIAINIYK